MFDDIKEIVQSYPALAVIVMYFWVRSRFKNIEEKNGFQDKEVEECKIHSDKNIEKMEVITDAGIKSGEDSRKELWIEVRHLSDRVAKIEGRLNGGLK